jgi:hypothetical protein
VKITEDLNLFGAIPELEMDYEGSPFYGLTVIEYQGAIIPDGAPPTNNDARGSMPPWVYTLL